MTAEKSGSQAKPGSKHGADFHDYLSKFAQEEKRYVLIPKFGVVAVTGLIMNGDVVELTINNGNGGENTLFCHYTSVVIWT